jgi:hypothetical protein
MRLSAEEPLQTASETNALSKVTPVLDAFN